MTDDFLLHNLVVFARLIRFCGLDVSPEQISDLARMLEKIGVTRREDVYSAARALFVHRRADLTLFDRAFELFFQMRGKPQQSVIDPTRAPTRRVRSIPPKNMQRLLERETEQRDGQKATPDTGFEGADKLMTYSPLERLRQKNFEQFSAEEIREARRLIAAMDWQVGERKTRRKRTAARGGQVDFARVVRRNLKHGAELFHLPAREPKFKPRPLVVLADISGSMERYTRMVLHLLHALSQERMTLRLEVFCFGTRLTRITPDLKKRDVDAALRRVTQRVPDWSGGTRIGAALKTFNFNWARRVLRAGAVVLIISDGWDRGDLELLRDEMARLRRSCYRLIWLNPLQGNPSFQATAQGLQVALPFVDDVLPVHNLISLQMLVAKLSGFDAARPRRRQMPRVSIPANETLAEIKVMERPQMGTSDYVRRTMTLRTVNGAPQVGYEENPNE